MVTTLASPRSSVSCVLVSALALAFASLMVPAPAKAQDVEVTSAYPSAAPQATFNLDVSIKGSGFKKGFQQARFYVTGTTNPGGITVNATRYKSPTELIANVDVAEDAVVEKFDIEVMSGGRTGKGTELFSVLAKGQTCETLPLPADWSLVTSLNDPVNPQFGGEFGRAIAVDRILLSDVESLVVAVGSRISGTVEVFLLDPADGTVLSHPPSLTLPGGGSLRLAQGDVDEDSLPDVVVGQEDLESAYVFLAQFSGATLTYSSAIPLLPPAGEDKAAFGASVAVGDVDHSHPGNEVLVGARHATVGAASGAGKVFVFGFDGTAFNTLWVVTRPAPKRSDYFGASLAVGDVVGTDGYPDLIVGAHGVDVGTVKDVGKVFVFHGPLSSAAPVELTRSVREEGLGYRSAVGDVDGNSVDDVVTVGYLKPPAVVFAGPVSSEQPARPVLWPQAGLELGFGTNITAGDINGDGMADVVVATPNAGCGGTAYVYLSGVGGPLSSQLRLEAPDAAEGFYGWAVAAVPGTRVLLVGEPRRTLGSISLAGQVYAYLLP